MLPKIFRPIIRNTLIFYLALAYYLYNLRVICQKWSVIVVFSAYIHLSFMLSFGVNEIYKNLHIDEIYKNKTNHAHSELFSSGGEGFT